MQNSPKEKLYTVHSRCVAIHGGRYEYLDSEYINSLSKLSIVCSEHGLFEQAACSHLKGCGCPVCGQKAREATALKKFKEKSSNKHCGKYAYGAVSGTRISIVCHEHGEFKQERSAHLAGHGCPSCGLSATAEAASILPEQFEAQASARHSGKYAYIGDYTRTKNMVTIVCPNHGKFSQLASAHLRGQGCPSCAQVVRSAEKRSLWSDPLFKMKMHGVFAENFDTRSANSRHMWADSAFREKALLRNKDMWKSIEFRNKMAIIRQSMPIISALNKTVFALLERLGIPYVAEHPVGPWNFDVFIPSHNLLIECQGEYWHNLPRAVRNDKSKATYIEKYFPELRLVAIWEVEFYKEGRLENILRGVMGLETTVSVKDISFDTLSVRNLDRKEAATVYSHHYLGSCRGNVHYGLYYQEQLIGACSFGPFQRNEQTKKYGKDAVELTRFCLHPEHQVKNLGSWFLSRCLKLIKKTVVTYADTTQGHTGALYKACNFRFSHIIQPDYCYVDEKGWVMHKKTAWNRAINMKMNEAEYATLHGLQKKWGGEKLCFIYLTKCDLC